MSVNNKTYTIEAPCYGGAVIVRWREEIDVIHLARQMVTQVKELLAELKNSIDPYAEDGVSYLEEYAKELETWEPKLPSEEAMQHVTRAIGVLRGLWGEIDRVEGTVVNNLIQRISFDAQAALENVERT